jgi:hypothetical protein
VADHNSKKLSTSEKNEERREEGREKKAALPGRTVVLGYLYQRMGFAFAGRENR